MHTTETIKCSFAGTRGLRLDARIDRPKQVQDMPMAIISHCFTCTKETLTTFRISRGLAQRGIGVLRFDFTGLGGSEGRFADTNFSTMVDDILAAADYLQQNDRAATTLIGHSMGGTASLLASSRLSSCRSVVTVASPSEPAHVLHHFGSVMQDLAAGRDAHINVAGTDYPVKQQFIDDVRSYHMDRLLVDYDRDLLVVRAGQDALVDAADAEQILALSQGHTTLLDLEEADHLFSRREHSDQLVDEIAHWILKAEH